MASHMYLCIFSLFYALLSILSIYLMEYLRIGSLNVNGLRDNKKQALVSEIFNIKNIAVGFLSETHSNE